MANEEIIMPDSELESRYERYKGVIKNLTLMSAISAGSQPPADIASGRRLRVRCAGEVCHAIA